MNKSINIVGIVLGVRSNAWCQMKNKIHIGGGGSLCHPVFDNLKNTKFLTTFITFMGGGCLDVNLVFY